MKLQGRHKLKGWKNVWGLTGLADMCSPILVKISRQWKKQKMYTSLYLLGLRTDFRSVVRIMLNEDYSATHKDNLRMGEHVRTVESVLLSQGHSLFMA